jgi:protein-tyrosine-phosphatase
MAEGLLRHDLGDRFEVESAGTKPTHVRPEAITAMRELGIDIFQATVPRAWANSAANHSITSLPSVTMRRRTARSSSARPQGFITTLKTPLHYRVLKGSDLRPFAVFAMNFEST